MAIDERRPAPKWRQSATANACGRWTAGDAEMWEALTGEREATTKVLCNLARRVRKNEEEA